MSFSRVMVAGLITLGASVASANAQGYSWTGFYGGVHLGGMTVPGAQFTGAPLFGSGVGASGTANVGLAQLANGNTDSATALMGGAQIGYNWRLYQSFVAGLEADISAVGRNTGNPLAGQNGNAGFPANPNFNAISNAAPLEYLGTVRARFGYLVAEPLLLYISGGFAYGQTNTSSSITEGLIGGPPIGIQNGVGGIGNRTIRTGYTAGGGLEYAIDRNVSLRIEGFYYDLGSATDNVNVNVTAPGGFNVITGITKSTDFNGAIARVGVNYLF